MLRVELKSNKDHIIPTPIVLRSCSSVPKAKINTNMIIIGNRKREKNADEFGGQKNRTCAFLQSS